MNQIKYYNDWGWHMADTVSFLGEVSPGCACYAWSSDHIFECKETSCSRLHNSGLLTPQHKVRDLTLLQLEKVIGLLRLPALLSKIRSQYGERAETVLLQVVRLHCNIYSDPNSLFDWRLGQATASAIVFRAVKELKGTEKSSSVFDVYKDFKLLFELDLVKRCVS